MSMLKETLKIKPFDIKKIKKDNNVVLIGKRMTGKSCVVRDILSHHIDIPEGIIVSRRTDPIKHYYNKFVQNVSVHPRYNTGIIKNFITLQTKKINEKILDPSAILLMDECTTNWSKDEGVKTIFCNSRNLKTLFLLTIQYPMDIPPLLRSNIDFTFIFKHTSESDREKIYNHYAGIFPTKEKFNHVLDYCTKDNHCLVIDNTATIYKIENLVFIYKAKSHDNFSVYDDYFPFR